MAGSMKWFLYTTDGGTDFAAYRDESNTEAINGGTQDLPDGSAQSFALPKNLTPRYATFLSADRTVRRNCIILTPTIFAGLGGGSSFTDPVSGKVVILSSKVGEVIRYPVGVDTGLTDGDAT